MVRLQRSRYNHSPHRTGLQPPLYRRWSFYAGAAVCLLSGSDPWKMSRFRALMRLTTDCVHSSDCDHSSAAFRNYTRFVLKSAEHTWVGT